MNSIIINTHFTNRGRINMNLSLEEFQEIKYAVKVLNEKRESNRKQIEKSITEKGRETKNRCKKPTIIVAEPCEKVGPYICDDIESSHTLAPVKVQLQKLSPDSDILK
jgi:hypothetical protein